MSLIGLFLFGVNDNNHETGHNKMNAYIWHKKERAHNADNNTTLCLFKSFKKRGF